MRIFKTLKVVTLFQAIDQAVTDGFCTVMAQVIPFHQFMANVNLVSYAVSNSPANAMYMRVCNRPPPAPPSGFTGGQCQGVNYRVTVRRVSTTRIGNDPSTDQNFNQTFSVNAIGPISGVSDRAIYPAQSSDVHLSSGGGDVFVSTGFVGGSVKIIRATVSIDNIQRVDNAADTCGNPPSNPTIPDGGNEYPTNVTYNDNNGGSFTVPVVIAFGYANVSANGEFNIPVSVNFTLQPELNFDLDFNLNTGKTQPSKPRNPTLPSPDPDDPSPDNPTTDPSLPPIDNPAYPDEPDEPEDVEKKTILKGVIVSVYSVPSYLSEVYQNANPDLILPDFGQVQFQIALRGIKSFTKHVKVQSVREFIPCPWQFGGVAVTGTPRAGVTWELTPVFTKQVYVKRFPPEEPT